FAVVIGVADIFGVDPWKSFWSNFERMEGYITTIHLLMYFLVVSAVMNAEKIWKRFLEWSVWSSLAMSAYCLFQLAGVFQINQGGVRVDGLFGNATYLAIYMVFNVFFALILIFRDSVVWKRVVYGVIGFLDLVILYYTATRGSILGLIGGLLLAALLIALFDKKERRLRIVAGSIIGVIAVLVLGFIAVRNTSFVAKSPVLQRFATLSFSDSETVARTYIWTMAIKGWEERPILGWGQENFNYIFNKFYDPRMYSQEQWFDHAHNAVLDWLDNGGVIGLLAYLSLFGAALYLLWKKSNDMSFTEKSLFTGLGAAYFFHNLFVFDNIVSYILFVSLLGYLHFKSTRLAAPIAADAEALTDSDMRMAVPVAIVILVFVIYFFNWRGYETNVALIQGLRASSAQPVDAQAALDGFEKALSYDTLGRPEVVERLVEAAPVMNGSSVSIDIRQKYFDMAQAAINEQLTRFPGDARYEAFAGTFFADYGDAADAEIHLKNAIALSPKKQSLMYQLGNFYESTKQYDKALTVFKQAYDLDHEDTDAANYYAVALVYAGQQAAAKQFLASAGLDTSMTSDQFVQAYAALGEWSTVETILKARIAANPNDLASRQNLAAAYYQSGDKADAVKTIQDMEQIDPADKAQLDAVIQQIQASK
ncbi:MAG: O-antigen ligase family protein, partial [Patescibacteria group bacterium]|nr:O-antigen ligase family protein [Patescibacteria group bacterium]